MTEVYTYFPAFLLVLVRVTSFFVTMPLFSYRTLPASHRVGLTFFISWIMFLSMEKPILQIDGYFIMLIFKEAMVGLMVGLVAYVIFAAIQIAGGFIDFQMGFAIANVIDPQTGAQSPLMGQYLYTFALLFLLSINGHHLLLDGIFYSYEFIPMEQATLPFGDENIVEFILQAFGAMFNIAFQMSMPVVGALFLVDIALGIVARTVPQLNVFVVGLPLKIGVSFVIMFIAMTMIFMLVGVLVDQLALTMR